MGFSFRKSVKIGPIRLNASKSGIGISGGVKGARISVSPKGKISTSIGANGVYYRSQIGGGKRTKKVQDEQIEKMEITAEKTTSPKVFICTFSFLLFFASLFFPAGFRAAGIIIAIIIFSVSIVLEVKKSFVSFDKIDNETETKLQNEYAETVKKQIIQNGVLSAADINALIDEYCQMIGVAAGAESEQIKKTMLQKREEFQAIKTSAH